MAGPLHQFEITPLFTETPNMTLMGLDTSFTNSSLWMVIVVTFLSSLLIMGSRRASLVPNRLQVFAEMLYDMVADMVETNVGHGGKEFFPFIFTLFAFILFANLMGLIPHSFTVTSHIAVTFALAFFVFLACTIIGFMKQGLGYFHVFFPKGAPLWTAFLLVPIELVSYLSRPVSLSIRLFANMTVGHVILKIVAGFVVSLGVFGILPLGFLVAVTALEFLIAVIQAYIFAILSCIYLSDALHGH